MAKKGQKFKILSDEQRLGLLNMYLNNEATPTMLSKKYGIPVQTIWTIIRKHKKKGYVEKDNHLRGRRKEENIDYKERYEILKNYQAFLKAQRERK